MSGFLHGVETIVVNNGAKPVNLVKTSVIGLVGTAPKGAANVLQVVASERQGVELFGNQLPGFTIPQALADAFAQGASRVIVCNVFNPATMATVVTDEAKVITAGKAKTTNAPTTVPVVKNNAGSTTFVAGTDYEIDPYGNLVVLNFTNIPEGSTVKFSYSHLNAAAITSAVIIGTVDVNNNRTGFKSFAGAYAVFGYTPKILIAPKYCETDAVAAEMIVQANTLRAVALIDAPNGQNPPAIITGRGPVGVIPGFKTSDKRTGLLYPYLKGYDPATDAQVARPYSPYMAGVMSANENYWESSSNKEIKGISGPVRQITAGINDANSEANQLNEVGVTTVFTSFGTGLRTWGNRSAAFPSNTGADSFLAVQRTRDIVEESLELSMLQFIDRPINQALIDSIRDSAQGFINVLIGRGALLPGSKITYDPTENPAVEIAAGKLCFGFDWASPTAAERITFKSYLDINLLANLV